MLLQFDTNLAEMFFGQYPIIVEGDTEYAEGANFITGQVISHNGRFVI